MAAIPMTLGHSYALCSADGLAMLEVKAFQCQQAGLFRLGMGEGCLRIGQNGGVDTKGGRGGLCNFSVEVNDSGLVSLIRGPFRLSSGDADNFLMSSSKDSPVSSSTLWSIKTNETALPLKPNKMEQKKRSALGVADEALPRMVRFRQGALNFGPFLRKDGPDGSVLFQGTDGGYLRMAGGKGAVDAKGGGGPPCRFIMEADSDGIRLQTMIEPRRFLGVSSWGALTGCEVESSCRQFCLEAACPEEPVQPPQLIGRADFDESVDFTVEERMAFIRDGFIIIRNAIPSTLVDAALGHINSALLMPGSISKGGDGTLQVCPAAKGSDAVQALLYATPLWTLAQRLLGRGCVAHSPASQLALRAPNLGAAPLNDDSIPAKQWHIDGMDKGNHSPFSILLGIALSEQSLPNYGNLVAFRGSHHVLQPLLRKEVVAGSGIFSDESGQTEGKPALSGGQQILLKPGDAVLLHQKVAHRVGVNHSPHIRYQTYFRLSHVDHAQRVEDGSLLDDLWTEFDGLKDDLAKVSKL